MADRSNQFSDGARVPEDELSVALQLNGATIRFAGIKRSKRSGGGLGQAIGQMLSYMIPGYEEESERCLYPALEHISKFVDSKMVWQRPKEGYPRVWVEFVCEKTKQKFVIKDLTPEYYDIALGYMTNIFLTESAICKPLRILEDPVSRRQMQHKWLTIMKADMALVCCTDDDEVPRVAGVHFTTVREDGGPVSQDPATSKYDQFTRVVEELVAAGDLFRRFGADRYLWSLGLFVLPEFRGLGIATHILKSRLVMCRALGLRGTANVFSTAGAQAAARAAGYGALAERGFAGQRLILMGTHVE